jgi:hypothetical protein
MVNLELTQEEFMDLYDVLDHRDPDEIPNLQTIWEKVYEMRQEQKKNA